MNLTDYARKSRTEGDNDVLDVFGPEITPWAAIQENPAGAFEEGVYGDLSQSSPLLSVQALMLFGGEVIKNYGGTAVSAEIGRLATPPIGRTRSQRLGSVILYSAYQAYLTNTLGGAHVARTLIEYYRDLLQLALDDVTSARIGERLTRLTARFQVHAWHRIKDALREIDENANAVARAGGAPAWLRTRPQYTLFIGSAFKQWLEDEGDISAQQRATALQINDAYGMGKAPSDWRMFSMAGNPLIDLSKLLNVRRLPATEMSVDNNRSRFAMGQQDYTSDLVDRVSVVVASSIGGDADDSVLVTLVNAYRDLIDKKTKTDTPERWGGYFYIFLFVWLPLRTGVGFDRAAGLFRSEPIVTTLVRSSGLVPLLSHAMYNTSVASNANGNVWTLLSEMTEFNAALFGEAATQATNSVTVLLQTAPPMRLRSWLGAPASVYEFRNPSFLATLYHAALVYARNGRDVSDSPWLRDHLTGADLVGMQPALGVQLRADQRTLDHAAVLYSVASDRVGAPLPDTVSFVVGEPNHGEFGADMPRLVDAVMNQFDGHPLYIFVGAALCRVPLNLAYKHPSITCLVLPAASLANNPVTGNRATATRWCTAIRDEMAHVSGDQTLSTRVHIETELTLSEHHAHALRIYDAGLGAVRRSFGPDVVPSHVFLVFNHINAAVQFDVQEALFVKQARILLRDIGEADRNARKVHSVLSTVQLTEFHTPIAAIGMPMITTIQSRVGVIEHMWYDGPLTDVRLALIHRAPDAVARQRRTQLFRDLAVGRTPTQALLEDSMADVNSALEVYSGAPNSEGAQRAIKATTVRLAVAAMAMARFGVSEQAIASAISAAVTRIKAVRDAIGASAQLDSSIDLLAHSTVRVLPFMDNQQRRSEAIRAAVDRARGVQSDQLVSDLVILMGDRNVVTTMARSAEEALSAATDTTGTRCVARLNTWATALFALVDLLAQEYQGAAVTSLDGAQAAVNEAWTPMAQCMGGLVVYAREMQHVSLARAAGPALLYAQIISDTMLYVQRVYQMIHVDQKVPFAVQEEPHLQWATLQAKGDRRTTVLLADLLFERRSWVLPLQLEHTIAGVSLRPVAEDTLKRSLRMLYGYETFGVQYERHTDAFHAMGNVFRLNKQASVLPLNFFVPAQEYSTMRSEQQEKELGEHMRAAAKRIETAEKGNLAQMMPRLIDLYIQLAYAYVSGGLDAVMVATNSYSDGATMDEAMSMVDPFRLRWPFEVSAQEGGPVDLELIELLQTLHRSQDEAQASVAAIRAFERRIANSTQVVSQPIMSFDGRLVSTPQDTYYVLTPRNGAALLDADQKRHVRFIFFYIEKRAARGKHIPPERIKRTAEQAARGWFAERRKVVAKQSEVWIAALSRMAQFVGSKSTRDSLLNWMRLRLPSWVERIRQVAGPLSDQGAWSTVVAKLSRRMLDVTKRSTVTDDAVAAYQAYLSTMQPTVKDVVVVERLIKSVVRFYNAAITESQVTRATELLMGALTVTGAPPINLARITVERKDLPTQEPDEQILGLYAQQLGEPARRFGADVMLDADRIRLEEMGGKTDEARIVAAIVTGVSRYVQFVDAATHRASEIGSFVAAIRGLDPLDYLDNVYDLLAARLAANRLLYQD